MKQKMLCDIILYLSITDVHHLKWNNGELAAGWKWRWKPGINCTMLKGITANTKSQSVMELFPVHHFVCSFRANSCWWTCLSKTQNVDEEHLISAPLLKNAPEYRHNGKAYCWVENTDLVRCSWNTYFWLNIYFMGLVMLTTRKSWCEFRFTT